MIAVDGWLILDKPSGITSAHAVAKVKRLLRPTKIGHAGTLDPLASGVLPLALGEATKTMPYLLNADKSYVFTVSWGQERSTDDCEGHAVACSELRPRKEDLLAVIPEFMGQIQQVPPIFSALKIDGQRAYALARAGEAVELKPREVGIHDLELIEFNELCAKFKLSCSKGTYVRSLGRDIGRRLGCLGHISQLRRTSAGHFNESHAISLEVLQEMVHNAATKLWPVDAALDDILAWDISSDQAMCLKMGRPLPFPIPRTGENDSIILLAKCNGVPVAVCEASQGSAKPVRVFNLNFTEEGSYDVE